MFPRRLFLVFITLHPHRHSTHLTTSGRNQARTYIELNVVPGQLYNTCTGPGGDAFSPHRTKFPIFLPKHELSTYRYPQAPNTDEKNRTKPLQRLSPYILHRNLSGERGLDVKHNSPPPRLAKRTKPKAATHHAPNGFFEDAVRRAAAGQEQNNKHTASCFKPCHGQRRARLV